MNRKKKKAIRKAQKSMRKKNEKKEGIEAMHTGHTTGSMPTIHEDNVNIELIRGVFKN